MSKDDVRHFQIFPEKLISGQIFFFWVQFFFFFFITTLLKEKNEEFGYRFFSFFTENKKKTGL